jgi:cell division septum initiation protein DivIVA
VRPRRPVSQDVVDVQDAIGKVSKKIEDLEEEIATAKEEKLEGWQAEVAALRRKEEQLREEKSKLQEEKLLLLKKDADEQP